MNSRDDCPFTYIDTESALEELIGLLPGNSRVALDTEGDSLHHYFEKVCLMQITVDQGNFIVDPLAGMGLAPLLGALKEKILIIHGGDYDLRMLRNSFGFRPGRPVFDTMLAARLLGYEKIGLAALVEKYFNVSLPKHSRKSDWSRRPLSQKQLHYACDDTRYLLALADILEEELRSRDRLRWHRENCEALVESTAFDNRRDPENIWRIRGVGKLDPRLLAYVRELWRWRDAEARNEDRPPFKVIGNQRMLELAEWAYENPGASLSRGPKLPRNCRGRRLHKLKEAIQRAERLPESKLPPRERRSSGSPPQQNRKKLINILRRECSLRAEELGLQPSVLAPRSALVSIAYNEPENVEEMMEAGPLMRWQAEILLPGLRKILADYNKDEKRSIGTEDS